MSAAAIIDTHCHLDVAEFDADRDAVIERARKAGVSDIVVPAIRRDTWTELLDFCDTKTFLHPALGMHPVYLKHHRDEHLEELDRLLTERRPLAVGEIGLDYFIRELDRKRQRQLCAAQFELALRHHLPVILHVRKAHDDMLALLREHGVSGGIVHAFNGSIQQGEKYIELGMCLGFGGMLTYARSRKLRTLAAKLPLDAIVLETDAPDLTPEAHRGKRNSPEFLPECLASLAEVRALPEPDVAAITSANARAVLNMPTP
jgi:TatD DNase family protein